MHSFKDVGAVETIDDITFYNPTSDGKAHPGIVYFNWSPVKGAKNYNVYIGTQDPKCQSGPDVITLPGVTTDPEDPSLLQASAALQPDEHYFVEIEPIGPNGFDGQPSSGGCNKLEFDTASLSAPILSGPANTLYANADGSAPIFSIGSGDGYMDGATLKLEIFDMSPSGTCTTTATIPVMEVALPADAANVDVTPSIPPASRKGLCWQVTTIAKNGDESPTSALQTLYYYLPTINKVSPGASIIDVIAQKRAYTLGNNSYGTPLTFNWAAQPGAYDYVLKVERWYPYYPNGTVDPPNCSSRNAAGTKDPTPGFPCTSTSMKQVSRTTIASNSVTLSGDESKGRNCWTVWPELAKVDGTGVAENKPDVEWYPHFCYTGGPAPVTPDDIVIDTPPEDYPTGPITGHIKFAYVPDGQLEVGIDPPQGVDIKWDKCPMWQYGAGYFNDYYDCECDFTITNPQPNTTYTITARTWNSDVHPPVKDASTLKETPKTISTACGDLNQACCHIAGNPPPYDSSCGQQLACVSKKCVPCGDVGLACCDYSTEPTNGRIDDCQWNPDASPPIRQICNPSDKCESCGLPGQICCGETCDGKINSACSSFGSTCPCPRAGDVECTCPDHHSSLGYVCNGKRYHGKNLDNDSSCGVLPDLYIGSINLPDGDFYRPGVPGRDNATVNVCNRSNVAKSVTLKFTQQVLCNGGPSASCWTWGVNPQNLPPSGYPQDWGGQQTQVCSVSSPDSWASKFSSPGTAPTYTATVPPNNACVPFVVHFYDICYGYVGKTSGAGQYAYNGDDQLSFKFVASCDENDCRWVK